jgi:2-succinyl-5-enolpyruvyl-6-hydroxy-3-cyclohexene-1-carboxylate synthase
MKTKINRNYFWAETFIRELASIGVKYACISPGSRNTPLTLAAAYNKNIKSYVHIDERCSAFFALGLAKASETPVVVISTSGTATAELYPAIIEAYQHRVPLIICTADRPPELLDVGANQTINQNNLYKNHIRWFFDAGLPEPIPRRLKHIKALAKRAVFESLIRSRGPVHINFPFRKPFEPDVFTDEIGDEVLELSNLVIAEKRDLYKETEKDVLAEKWFKEVASLLIKYEKGLIIAGPENYNPLFHNACQALAEILNYPVLADGASQLRFGKHSKKNIISNFEGFLRAEKFAKNLQPDIIIQFGRTMISKALDGFLEKCNSIRFIINEYGDWFDPSNRANAAFACKPYLFCKMMKDFLHSKNFKRNSGKWLKKFKDADETALEVKNRLINNSKFPNECRIIDEIVQLLPDGSQLMISNSMPIRDFDYFASNISKNITVYNNRGASGIDGILSTALGIAKANKVPTFLLTGDSAFYYDMNALLSARKYSIPLIIVLINNNGGGIFEVLPVSKYGKVFKEYFVAPHDLDFAPFVKTFGGIYKLVESWQDFKEKFYKALKEKNFSVIEIRTDAAKSLKLRENFWKEVSASL